MRVKAARSVLLTLFLATLTACGALDGGRLHYPAARRDSVVDTYNGVKVPDPYRWLENTDSQETRQWIEAENTLTTSYLDALPGRKAIGRRLRKLWNYERYGVPFQRGGRYFFTKNDGLQPQSVLYVANSLESEPRLLLDPNTFSKDGTIAISGLSVSTNGRYLAYSTSDGGSDWQEWHVRDIDTGEDLPDHIRWSKFSDASWTSDDLGFYYTRFDAPKPGEELKEANYDQLVSYHRLGTDPTQDPIVYQRPDHKNWTFGTEVSEDGRWLILTVYKGTDSRNLLFYEDLKAKKPTVHELVPNFVAGHRFVAAVGRTFYLWTDRDAPLGRLVAVDLRHPEPAYWKDIASESKDTLQSVTLVHDTFIARYLHDAHALVRFFAMDGARKGELKLPGIGSVHGFGGHRGDVGTFYAFSGFTTPTTIYRLDLTTGRSSIFKRAKVPFDPSGFETRQVFFTSRDGTRVPMFITARKGLRFNGLNPTLLYGYGGFDISLTPHFSVSRMVWMEMGGVYAVANLRGGGEYGEAWHKSGMLKNKQHVFDDFIAAAQWLEDTGITSPRRLAIQGGSNGGLLIGAVLNQRPDLFGAAVAQVGVMDMLRFNKWTIGWAWQSEYGSPEDPEMFKVLYAYSPYHNIRRGAHYPATLITTADHDDRVFPAHSFKYAARLQAAQAGPEPILIRIETRAGHGAGMPTKKRMEEATDILTFLTKNLGMTVPRSWGGENTGK